MFVKIMETGNRKRLRCWIARTKCTVCIIFSLFITNVPGLRSCWCQDPFIIGPPDMSIPFKAYNTAVLYPRDDIVSENAIRFWDPYPNQNLTQHQQEHHCALGDVGMFTPAGSFLVLFNVFLSREDNLKLQYQPPPSFEPMALNGYIFARPQHIFEKTFLSSNFVICPCQGDNG